MHWCDTREACWDSDHGHTSVQSPPPREMHAPYSAEAWIIRSGQPPTFRWEQALFHNNHTCFKMLSRCLPFIILLLMFGVCHSFLWCLGEVPAVNSSVGSNCCTCNCQSTLQAILQELRTMRKLMQIQAGTDTGLGWSPLTFNASLASSVGMFTVLLVFGSSHLAASLGFSKRSFPQLLLQHGFPLANLTDFSLPVLLLTQSGALLHKVHSLTPSPWHVSVTWILKQSFMSRHSSSAHVPNVRRQGGSPQDRSVADSSSLLRCSIWGLHVCVGNPHACPHPLWGAVWQ